MNSESHKSTAENVRKSQCPPCVRSATTDWFAFAWGFAEGTLFFLVPDMLLTLTAAHSPLRSLRHMLFVIAGSLVAGLCLFMCASKWPGGSIEVVDRVPFVPHSMFDRVEGDYTNHGATALLRGPTSGIPYKVYAVLAPSRVDFGSFMLLSVPARAERLLITWAQFALFGWLIRKYSKQPIRWIIGLWCVYWTAVYALYWSRVGAM